MIILYAISFVIVIADVGLSAAANDMTRFSLDLILGALVFIMIWLQFDKHDNGMYVTKKRDW